MLITAAAPWFVGRASDLIGYLVLAQLLAFALEPAVMWLHQRRGWRRGSATGLLLAGILLLFVVLGVGMGAVLADQVDGAAGQLPVWIDKLNAYTQQHFGTTVVSTSSAAESGEATQQVTEYLQEHAGDLLGAVGSLVGAAFSLFTVGLFTFSLTANGPQIRRVLLSRMPPERQRRALWAWTTAIEKTGGYLHRPGRCPCWSPRPWSVQQMSQFRRCAGARSCWSPASWSERCPLVPAAVLTALALIWQGQVLAIDG